MLAVVERHGVTHLSVAQEPQPPLLLHNRCPYSLYYGQTAQGFQQRGESAAALTLTAVSLRVRMHKRGAGTQPRSCAWCTSWCTSVNTTIACVRAVSWVCECALVDVV